MSELTPREIVNELDRYIVGQHDAKRAVANALRSRWRRMQLAPDMREVFARIERVLERLAAAQPQRQVA